MHILGSVPEPFYFRFKDAEFLKMQLNAWNAFDFDYKPKVNDELMIHIPGEGNLILYFRRGRWTFDHEPLGNKVIEEKVIHKGPVENNMKWQ